MHSPLPRILALPLFCVIGGCATFGTNINGDFACRAGTSAHRDDCPPARAIDAKALANLVDDTRSEGVTLRRTVPSGDTSRTAERTLRIIIPAFVDSAGILHEEAVAWAVVEAPEWKAQMRRTSRSGASGLARSIARRVHEAQNPDSNKLTDSTPSTEPNSATDTSPSIDDDPFFSLTSPLALPSTAREAVAGAKAPAVEGFDMASPSHVRTPRSPDETPLVYPTAEAIDAAKSKKEPE